MASNRDKIKQIISAANKKAFDKVKISPVSDSEAVLIKNRCGIDVRGYSHVIDSSGVIHALKKHGNEKEEKSRGLIAINENDFQKIPKIIKARNIAYVGKNRLGKDCLLYVAKIGATMYYVTEIRTKNKELCLNTFYKKKVAGS